MRDIKFRGKRIDNGEWVYGGVWFGFNDAVFIVQIEGNKLEHYQVDPETVGQFSGVHDKKKNEVFEGDLVSLDGWEPKVYQVKFIHGHFVLAWFGRDSGRFKSGEYVADIRYVEYDEVVGNVHESPELLQETL